MAKMSIRTIRSRLAPILRKHSIRRAGIFGSAARGSVRKDSDIDVLVKIEKNISLFDFVGIQLEMEKALGKKVDLVEYGTIKPALKQRILAEEVSVV